MYKGLGPAVISGTPYIGLQMTFYEVFKSYFAGSDGQTGVMFKMVSGAAAGILAQSVAYPGDTLKRRMQTNGIGGHARVYNNSWDAVKKIYRLEGVRGFYQGLFANVLRAIPDAALQFVAYEQLKKIFGVP